MLFIKNSIGKNLPHSLKTRFSLAVRTASSSSPESASQVPVQKDAPSTDLMVEKEIPIERRSLTRGLSLNRFEKDFMIYPEYNETFELERIKKHIAKIENDFEKALVTTTTDETDILSSKKLTVLLKNELFRSVLPKTYGGTEFSHKDLLILTEALAKEDLSTFVTFNQVQSAATLLLVHGTAEQKEKYLPKIASFECKPAVCVYDETHAEAEITKVIGRQGQSLKLSGLKTNVFNANHADLFFVFAKRVHDNNLTEPLCYIIDKNDMPTGSITIQERINTQGLNLAHVSKVKFSNITVTPENQLGSGVATIHDMLAELNLNGKTFYGAAVCGFLKKLIDNITQFANSNMDGKLRISDTHPVQAALTELGIGMYVLESMVYYLGGLIDEDLYLLNDVENTIIQFGETSMGGIQLLLEKYANRILRKALVTISDVAGMSTSDCSFPFEKMIRDIITLISTTDSDLKMVRKISLPTLESYIVTQGNLSTLMEKCKLKRIFGIEDTDTSKFDYPKMTHFIGEHVHPSFVGAARDLETSMSRTSQAIDHLLTDKGLFLKEDYVALKQLSTVMENNFGMVASIARASRSYAIGLRNAEIELDWVTYYCVGCNKENELILKDLMDVFGYLRFTPKLTGVGRMILENNGYFIEKPVEKNW